MLYNLKLLCNEFIIVAVLA